MVICAGHALRTFLAAFRRWEIRSASTMHMLGMVSTVVRLRQYTMASDIRTLHVSSFAADACPTVNGELRAAVLPRRHVAQVVDLAKWRTRS